MKNGVIISGVTGSTLRISSVTISDIGEYKCTPSNSLGSTNSSSSILSVNGKNQKIELMNISSLFSSVPLTINGLSPQTIPGLVPAVPNGYTITPPNPKINLTSSGDLMTMILDYSDAGTYTITSSDFKGASVVITLTVQG